MMRRGGMCFTLFSHLPFSSYHSSGLDREQGALVRGAEFDLRAIRQYGVPVVADFPEELGHSVGPLTYYINC